MSGHLSTVENDFRKDIANHRMTVHRDDGLYRHLEFRKLSHGWHHWFEIITWPMCLCIRGDMGTWTFSRVEDMFSFFRGERINAGYWAEKLQHGTGSEGMRSAKVFSMNELKSQAIARLENYSAEDLTPEKRLSVIAELESEIFEPFGDHDEHDALTQLYNFSHHGVTFDPMDGPFGKQWSYHYLWCCWAIVWAIQQYDTYTQEKASVYKIPEVGQ